MGFISMLVLLFTHPTEFRTLLQYWLWHDQRDVTVPSEHKYTGWDRLSMRKCWGFLDLTSRSFAAVIQQLEGEMARVVRHPQSVSTCCLLNYARCACTISFFADWIPSRTT